MEIWRYKSVVWDESGNPVEYNITGQSYKQLIDLCFEHADCFSMAKAPWVYAKDKRLALALRDHRIREVQTNRWFGYKTPLIKINLYRVCKEAKESVLRFTDNLFLDSGDPKYFCSLEDLCFFKKDNLFFGTVSHERICSAHILTADFGNMLKCLGDWENESVNSFNHLSLSDF